MTGQETALTMLYGALAAAVAFGVYKAGRKAVDVSRELVEGLRGIGKIAESNQKLVESSLLVATELQMLRSLMTTPAVQDGEEPPAEGPRKPRPPVHAFPPPNMDLYAAVPDAKIEDTEIYETDDAKMKQYEDLEAIRQAGFEADPGELEEA